MEADLKRPERLQDLASFPFFFFLKEDLGVELLFFHPPSFGSATTGEDAARGCQSVHEESRRLDDEHLLGGEAAGAVWEV